jgi:hypothetical protein
MDGKARTDRRDDGDRMAGEELSARWTRKLETLTAKLARHHSDAEQLATAMRRRRADA